MQERKVGTRFLVPRTAAATDDRRPPHAHRGHRAILPSCRRIEPSKDDLAWYDLTTAVAARLTRRSGTLLMRHLSVSYSQHDFDDLVQAIRRYAEEDMDQWAAFRLATRHGDVFVSISLALPEGESLSMYSKYDPAS
jgi:hypothetical protein